MAESVPSGGATETPGASSLPPTYSDALKEKEAEAGPIGPQFVQQQPPMPMVYPQAMQAGAPVVFIAQQQPTAPKYGGPHDFLFLVVLVAVACGLLNITSIVFSIPAVTMVILSRSKKEALNYPAAQKYAVAGFILSLISVTWTLLWIFVIVTSILVSGYSCTRFDVYDSTPRFCDYYFYYY